MDEQIAQELLSEFSANKIFTMSKEKTLTPVICSGILKKNTSWNN